MWNRLSNQVKFVDQRKKNQVKFFFILASNFFGC